MEIKEILKKIPEYIENGLITERQHPENPSIKIYNYTPETQYSRKWDEVTRACRGLVVDTDTKQILARPFEKFHNYQELIQSGMPIPDEPAVVAEKMDGSLGILININGRPWIATRGSFMSEQAMWATNWWRENVGDEPWGEEGVTYLFEILYNENRIVVNYDFEGLVHLASIETATGKTVSVYPDASFTKIRSVAKFDMESKEDLAILAEMDKPNSEGFVVFFPKANMRMKIKFPEYVRLHKICTGLSEIGIWEAMRDGKVDGLLKDVPDEFYKWFEEVRDRIQDEYLSIQEIALDQFEAIVLGSPQSRREWANKIKDMEQPGIGFSMLDGKDYSQAIWKMVRPHGQRTFKVDLDK